MEEERKKRVLESTREERLILSEKIAEEGIVLLKNDGVLPLKDGQTVSISGGAATDYTCGAGSSKVRLLEKAPTLKAELEKVLPNSVFSHDYRYKIVCSPWDCIPDEAVGKDVALVCVGTEDSEGSDRPCGASAAPSNSGIRLPLVMEDLIIRTARLNPNTVVVLYCGAAIDMTPWIDKVSAVVWAGYFGERGQCALARILSGKVNPSGKLTETFPINEKTTGVAECYRDSFVNVYSDGLLVGYRWHDMQAFLDKPDGVRFPFGYGLSYSKYEYSNLRLEKDGDKVKVTFTISNVEGETGKEVAQVYVREMRNKVFRPVKELKGFKKALVEKGGATKVEIALDRDAFAYYSTTDDCWKVEGGEYEILVGASSRDIRLKGRITV